jgi:hypothetical protein
MAVIGSFIFDLRILYYVLLHMVLFEDQPFDGVDDRVRDLFSTFRINDIHTCQQGLRNLLDEREGFQSFVDVLDQFAFSSHATDPRDRVYAFLALHGSSEPKFEVDYTDPTSTALTKFSLALAHTISSLPFLGLASRNINNEMLSWVVDWSTKTPFWAGRPTQTCTSRSKHRRAGNTGLAHILERN